MMASKTSKPGRSSATGGFAIGRKASANISRVEGLILSREMRTTFENFARKGISHDARRTALTDKYGKKGS